ncbi:MAG: DUF721 domain-containing protein [Prevotellaceae bacterium]|jgi:hypothetical protein|nr:DUF721 domain-containing protein [Prevotellaceae bacterium]
MQRREPAPLSQNLLMSSLRAICGDEAYYKLLETNLATDIIPKVLGKVPCSYISEMKFYNKTLYIKVNSAPFRQTLLLQRASLIKRLNAEAGIALIKEIVFR